MTTVVLISCASKKLAVRARAEDLYISPLFRLALRYARCLSPETIYILSAKYGLVSLVDELEPYDLTLNSLSSRQRRDWAARVLEQLRGKCDLATDHFVILAGSKYREHLVPHLAFSEVPLAGLSIGKQLQFLSRAVQK